MKLVSCLLVTQPGREHFASEAIACFEAQDYPNKELITVVDPKDNRSLGDLRNESIKQANGHYVATWDDDDLYGPQRLSKQIEAIETTKAEACFLESITIRCICGFQITSQPNNSVGVWENTMLAKKSLITDSFVRYPSLPWGEDTVMVRALLQSSRKTALLKSPESYIYRFHGGNTCNPKHWDNIFWDSQSTHMPSRCAGKKQP